MANDTFDFTSKLSSNFKLPINFFMSSAVVGSCQLSLCRGQTKDRLTQTISISSDEPTVAVPLLRC